jgi:hypothetical protein
MRDFITEFAAVSALAAASVSATAQGLAVDLRGCNSVGFVTRVASGATLDATNFFTLSFEEADDNGSGAPGTYSAVPAAKVFGDTKIAVAGGGMYKTSCLSEKRWVRPVLTETGTAVATIDIVALKGNLSAEGKGW